MFRQFLVMLFFLKEKVLLLFILLAIFRMFLKLFVYTVCLFDTPILFAVTRKSSTDAVGHVIFSETSFCCVLTKSVVVICVAEYFRLSG